MKFCTFSFNKAVQNILCFVSLLFLLGSVQCIIKTSHGIKGFSFLQMNEEYLKLNAVFKDGKTREDVALDIAEIQG